MHTYIMVCLPCFLCKYIYICYIYICLMFTPMCRSARFCWGGCAPCWREAGGSCEANEAFAGHGAAGGSVESPWEIQLTLGMGQAPDAGHAPEHMSERMPYGMSECMFRRHLRPHTGDHWSHCLKILKCWNFSHWVPGCARCIFSTVCWSLGCTSEA